MALIITKRLIEKSDGIFVKLDLSKFGKIELDTFIYSLETGIVFGYSSPVAESVFHILREFNLPHMQITSWRASWCGQVPHKSIADAIEAELLKHQLEVMDTPQYKMYEAQHKAQTDASFKFLKEPDGFTTLHGLRKALGKKAVRKNLKFFELDTLPVEYRALVEGIKSGSIKSVIIKVSN